MVSLYGGYFTVCLCTVHLREVPWSSQRPHAKYPWVQTSLLVNKNIILHRFLWPSDQVYPIRNKTSKILNYKILKNIQLKVIPNKWNFKVSQIYLQSVCTYNLKKVHSKAFEQQKQMFSHQTWQGSCSLVDKVTLAHH